MTKKIKTGIKRRCTRINLFNSQSELAIKECGLPQINLNGNRRVAVDGCTSVIEYSDDIIRLNIGKSVLKLIGTELEINGYFDSEIIICGKILEIKFGD